MYGHRLAHARVNYSHRPLGHPCVGVQDIAGHGVDDVIEGIRRNMQQSNILDTILICVPWDGRKEDFYENFKANVIPLLTTLGKDKDFETAVKNVIFVITKSDLAQPMKEDAGTSFKCSI